MRQESEAWWRQAEADLETARLLEAGGRPYAVSWFAQQAAEKGLKAMYIEERGKLPPRTHDLEFFGNELNLSSHVRTALTLLNPAFDMVRYPDSASGKAPVDDIGPDVSAGHLGAAEAVLGWARERLIS